MCSLAAAEVATQVKVQADGSTAKVTSDPPAGMVVGSVSEPLTAADGSTYLIFLPPAWTADASHPVLLFLHGIGGTNNAKGCRNPGLTTQFRLLDPTYAAQVKHIVIVPVAAKADWRHHLDSSIALVDMAVAELGGDPTRVAVAGQAMGGHGALVYASLRPDRFCAVIAICSFLDDRVRAHWELASSGSQPATADSVATALAAKPVWLLHSEEDDERPDPLRSKIGATVDDSTAVLAALKAAGNTAVKWTRYPKGQLPPNYITGHAAFEFAFNEDAIWPWLAAQRL